MIKLGITGGIGSGKSVVVSLLKTMGIPVYIADDEAKRLTNISPSIRDALITHFGKNLFIGTTLNRPLLASLIFGNRADLELVNSIIHPVVINDFQEWTKKYAAKRCVAIESAILFESKLNRYVDRVWSVYAPVNMRIIRAMKRDSIRYEDVIRRVESQLSDEEKSRLSDAVIYNDDCHAIIPQVEILLENYNVE